jgi:hypothetical protein
MIFEVRPYWGCRNVNGCNAFHRLRPNRYWYFIELYQETVVLKNSCGVFIILIRSAYKGWKMNCIKLIFVVFSLAFTSVAHADCYSIKHSDNKNVCLAKTKHQYNYCYSVKDSDTKNHCLASVKQQHNYCYSIRNKDLKNECLALTRN